MPDNKPSKQKKISYLPTAQKNLIKREEMAKVQTDCMEFYKLGAVKVKNDNELIERINEFLQLCIQLQTPVTVEKMCLSLGYATSTIWDWETGRRKGFSSDTAEIIKKAKSFIQTCDADLAIKGNMDKVVYIFRAKNYYGMKDQQDVVLTPNHALDTSEIDEEQLARRLLEDRSSTIILNDEE